MDDSHLGLAEEEKGRTELLCKLAREVDGDAPEASVTQEVVEVEGEQLKHQTQVTVPQEVTF